MSSSNVHAREVSMRALLPKGVEMTEKLKDMIPEELEKARAYLASEFGYELDYEQVREVIKAYLQIRARRIKT